MLFYKKKTHTHNMLILWTYPMSCMCNPNQAKLNKTMCIFSGIYYCGRDYMATTAGVTSPGQLVVLVTSDGPLPYWVTLLSNQGYMEFVTLLIMEWKSAVIWLLHVRNHHKIAYFISFVYAAKILGYMLTHWGVMPYMHIYIYIYASVN